MNPALRPTVGLVITVLVGVFLTVPSLATTPGFGGFLENIGQFDDPALFRISGSGAALYFTPEGLVLDVFESIEDGEPVGDETGMFGAAFPSRRRGCVVRILFDGAAGAPAMQGLGELPGRYHFFYGNDPAAWRTGARAFSEVLYQDVWPGIDLLLRTAPAQLEYEALVAPGADASRIRFVYEGADVVVPAPGDVHRIETPVGTLIHRLPVAGERSGAIFREGASAPRADPDNRFVVEWCTLLGGASWEVAWGITADDQGRPIAVGETASIDFPTTVGAYEESYSGGAGDVFVTKLSAAGDSLVWSTFLGGQLEDGAAAAAVDDLGNVVTVGLTKSTDFPTTPGAFDETASTPVDDWDAFATKLSAEGNSLHWSTLLGADEHDLAYDLVLDIDQNPVLVGTTYSEGFPTTSGAYRETFCCAPFRDGFVTKLAAAGNALVWSTLLGADDGYDDVNTVVLDNLGNAVVGGQTSSENFPTTPGAFDRTYNGQSWDGFLTKLLVDGSSLVWSTFVGGERRDYLRGVGLDPSGDVLAVGRTYSDSFPTTPGAFDRTYEPTADGFVLRMAQNGNSLVWSTYLGGSGTGGTDSGDWPADLGVGPLGTPVVVGQTSSTDFPTTPDALQPTHSGGQYDGFITFLKNDGSGLLWSTFCGGSPDYGNHEGFGVAPSSFPSNNVWVDDAGKIFVSGQAGSPDFPTFPSVVWDSTLSGTNDAVVLMLDLPTVDAPERPIRRDGLKLVCSPNPFRDGTSIRYALPTAASVRITVHDAAGRLVRVLRAPQTTAAGAQRLTWDGRDRSGAPVAAGVYFVRLKTADHIASEPVVLLR